MAQRNAKFEEPGTSGSGDNPNPNPTPKQAPNYLTAALRISSSYPLGAESADDNASVADGGIALGRFKPIPGYMVLNYVPTLGVSSKETSAVNRAAFTQFNAVRSKISGNRPYEPADLMIYMAAVDGMRQLYHYVRRIYGIARKYSATNLYRPAAALTAMGLDSKDWLRNTAELYQWLLDHRDSLKMFPTVPIGTISKKYEAYNTAIFTDGDIDSVQGYILNQRAFWSYEVVDEVKGLTPRSMPSTYTEFLDMWDEMYRGLQQSSDVYIIAADIRRAFENSYVTDLPETSETYEVTYTKMDPILQSVMNATMLGEVADLNLDMFRIVDNAGTIECAPVFYEPALGDHTAGEALYRCCMTNHINSIEAEPSDAVVLSSTRLKPVLVQKVGGNGKTETVITAMGTEVITTAYMVGYTNDGTTIESIPLSTLVAVFLSGQDGYVEACGTFVRTLRALANFDWHPPVITAAVNANGSTEISAIHEDIQNYIPISNYQLTSIHNAYLLSEFGI